MRKKSLLLLTLFLAASLTFTGCGTSSDPAGTSSASTSTSGSTVANPATAAPETTKPTVDYPKKEIQVIVPYKAGGDTDIYARTILAQAQKELGKAIVVVNVDGAGGSLGTSQVADADPDGYTALWMQPNLLMNNVTNLCDITYDSFTGTAISVMTRASVLIVKADSPYKDVNDLIKDMQARPGKIIFATQVGGYTHAVALALEKAAGSKLKKVDVGGGSAQITSIIGGQADVCVVEAGITKDYFTSGKVKALGNLGNKRSLFLPDLSTVFEQGCKFDIGIEKFFFTTFPKETPQEICDIFNAAIKKATESKEVKDSLANLYAEPAFIADEEADKYLKDMLEYYMTMKEDLVNDKF